jgi:DNA-binding Xre family transcriptional regulator
MAPIGLIIEPQKRLASLTNRQYIGSILELSHVLDKIMSIELTTPQDVQQQLASRFKARRLSKNLTQEGLAKRSGVSWSSLKRFESTGLIALESLLKISLVLDCLVDFDKVCIDDGRGFARKSLDEILSRPKTRRKGRIK